MIFYLIKGFGDNENANLPSGPATPSPAGNGHMMMFTHTHAANPGHTYNQRQPITQTYHPYRRWYRNSSWVYHFLKFYFIFGCKWNS